MKEMNALALDCVRQNTRRSTMIEGWNEFTSWVFGFEKGRYLRGQIAI